jgi:hypothetical protein
MLRHEWARLTPHIGAARSRVRQRCPIAAVDGLQQFPVLADWVPVKVVQQQIHVVCWPKAGYYKVVTLAYKPIDMLNSLQNEMIFSNP